MYHTRMQSGSGFILSVWPISPVSERKDIIMKWMRFRVRTTADAEDILVSAMTDIGLYGAQIEDHVPLTAAEKEQMFVDIMPDEPENDGSAVLSFYVEETEDGSLVLNDQAVKPEQVKEEMEEVIEHLRGSAGSDIIGDGTVTIEETADVDWVNNWKQFFHQFWIDDILVIPSWEKPQEAERKPFLTFHIDPGTAFGTGAHETTQLCIREIRKYLNDFKASTDVKILDIGTGSGILSILSLMLGAESAVGTDLDPCAEPAVWENLKANQVDPSKFRLILGNLMDDPKVQDEAGYDRYDIVVANILPNVLIPMTPAAVKALKPGGVYITSGILEGKESSVADAMRAAGLDVIDVTAQGEWRCVTGRK